MGSELLEEKSDSQKSYTETFKETFPYYLSIGMTYDQFFNNDVELVKYYKESEILKSKKRNEEMWAQGLYIYEALSVVNYNLHRKKYEKPKSYTSKPYDLYKEEPKLSKKKQVELEQAKAKVWLTNFVNAHK